MRSAQEEASTPGKEQKTQISDTKQNITSKEGENIVEYLKIMILDPLINQKIKPYCIDQIINNWSHNQKDQGRFKLSISWINSAINDEREVFSKKIQALKIPSLSQIKQHVDNLEALSQYCTMRDVPDSFFDLLRKQGADLNDNQLSNDIAQYFKEMTNTYLKEKYLNNNTQVTLQSTPSVLVNSRDVKQITLNSNNKQGSQSY